MSGNYYGKEDDLAYGNDYNQSRGSQGEKSSDRSLLGGTLGKLKSQYDKYSQRPQQQNSGYDSPAPGQQQYSQSSQPSNYGSQQQSTYSNQPYSSTQPAYAGGPPPQSSTPNTPGSGYNQNYDSGYGQNQGQKPDMTSKIFGGIQGAIHSIGTDVAGLLGTQYPNTGQQGAPGYGPQAYVTQPSHPAAGKNRFDSFAPPKDGNSVKWYVDGCSYMWAVSEALESARETIWILDWWLSPELYLRRPPAANEAWRLDRVLQRAAQRGVKINVIVYKEVTQALTLSSSHTKHALEDLSPNIGVFRHPDHLPDAQTTQSSITSSLQGLSLDVSAMSRFGSDALKGAYGLGDGVILYWAHHEKLCLIDGTVAFMGGLDLCFGRWDTNQHSITDAHPSDLNKIVFPGQDFNNARVADFNDVANPNQNKLDRTKSSRMGWSDVSIGLRGPNVDDLKHHFITRWNLIYDEKYNVRSDMRYARLTPAGTSAPKPQGQAGVAPSPQNLQPGQYPPPPGSQRYTPPAWQTSDRPHTSGDATLSSNVPPSPQSGVTQNTSVPSGYTFPPPPPGGPPSTFMQTQEPSSGLEQQQPQTFNYPQPAQYGAYPQQSYVPDPSITQPTPQSSYTAYHSNTPVSSQTYLGESQYQGPQNLQQSGYPQTTIASELPTQQSPPIGCQPGQQGTRGMGDDSYYSGTHHNAERGFGGSKTQRYTQEGKLIGSELGAIGSMIQNKVEQKLPASFLQNPMVRPFSRGGGNMNCQVLRSCTKWSHGVATEHSVQNAYIDAIQQSQFFIYIENQFFITATGEKQKPVKNQIGKALVERIIRAARERQPFKVIVVMPAIPAFAGDFMDEGSLGTRAICEFQYNSICRGGNSIMEEIQKAGFNPMNYIRFYNLRSYDRINYTSSMVQAQQQSGVKYEDARIQQENRLGSGFAGQGQGAPGPYTFGNNPAQQYQQAAQNAPNVAADRWDSVASCYMLGGEDIRGVAWSGPPEAEIDAFVSEELYVHSKVMIIDDRTVICGSANLNDRSMLGTHDSEIALMINDCTTQQSSMAGRPWQASRFAASLRRQLTRKHLGLIRPQDMQRPDANFQSVHVPNEYDWNSPEDNAVTDPLGDIFLSLWNTRARTNTEVYRKAFRAVPDDNVRSWAEYKEFFEYYFHKPTEDEIKKGQVSAVPKVEYGHVVREDFPGGAHELKELLSRVKGTVVEMPLCFLQNEDIAHGYSLNMFTEELYT